MSRRVSQLIRLVVAALDGDEDAQVVLAGHHLDGGARELGRDLVVAPGVQAAIWTANVKGADGRVVRCLLGKVGNPYAVAWRTTVDDASLGNRDSGGSR